MPTLDFKGKSFVYAHHLSVSFRELVVDVKRSLTAKGRKPSLNDNLIVNGDNLEALKALLPSHAGKIDCIFIDPPYNTGNEGWCYNDNVRSPLMKEWLKKSANPVDKEDLERHDKWLCMMWPRLQLLHELLADTGIIWITLDDNEVHRFRCILDEIFGEGNFLATIAWRKRYTRSNNAKMFYSQKDYVLVYRKSGLTTVVKEPRNLKSDSSYSNPDKDPKGPWMTASYVNPATKEQRKNLVYPIRNPFTGKDVEHPTHAWKYQKEENQKHIDEKRLWWGANGDAEFPRIKLYLDEAEQLVPVDFWNFNEAGSSDDGSQTIKDMFEATVFDNPKPVQLIRKILSIMNNREATILDSFAGSGTTGHAVLQANAEDGGNRRFILVQIDEEISKEQPAYKLGYRNVVEITAERIRRAANGYKFEGIQREELFRESLTYTKLKNVDQLIKKAEGFELLEKHRFDDIIKSVENGELVVTGEKKIVEKVEGLGGSFTFVTLGQEMSLDKLLTDGLPTFEALAKYVFFTATGRTLDDVPKADATTLGFIGETDVYRVHLLYQANKKWLQSNDAALTEKLVDGIIAANKKNKKLLIFAAAKFMGQRELSRLSVDFCQLPYAIHRILGD